MWIADDRRHQGRTGTPGRIIALLAALALLCAGMAHAEAERFEAFRGKRIAVQTGTISGEVAQAAIGDVLLDYYNSQTDCLAALRSGKVDAWATDEPMARFVLIENTDLELVKEMIIAVAEDAEERDQIRINPENKKISFSDSGLADICAGMIQAYGGSFKKGTYYSISGTRVDEGAYVFDFREAVEHNVKMGARAISAGASRQRTNSFSIGDRNGAQDRVTPMTPRGYGMSERAARG